MTVVATDSVPPRAAAATLGERHWRVAAIALLSVRFHPGLHLLGWRLAPLHLWPGEAQPGRAHLDGKQVPECDARRTARHRSPDCLPAASLLAALPRRDPVQRCRADRRRGADGRAADASHGAGLGWLLDGADADVRLAGR